MLKAVNFTPRVLCSATGITIRNLASALKVPKSKISDLCTRSTVPSELHQKCMEAFGIRLYDYIMVGQLTDANLRAVLERRQTKPSASLDDLALLKLASQYGNLDDLTDDRIAKSYALNGCLTNKHVEKIRQSTVSN